MSQANKLDALLASRGNETDLPKVYKLHTSINPLKEMPAELNWHRCILTLKRRQGDVPWDAVHRSSFVNSTT